MTNETETNLQRVSLFTCEVDKIITSIYHFIVHTELKEKTMCLLALGGYGRRELCPYSDIDLLILYKPNHNKEKIEKFIRFLWDLSMPLGCVVRTLPECSRILGQEMETDTAFLQSRYICGNRDLYTRLTRNIIQPYFRKRRMKYINEFRKTLYHRILNPKHTIFHIEPDIKNGICGLRDCQRILWSEQLRTGAATFDTLHTLSRFDKDDIDQFKNAYNFLTGLRIEMHLYHDRRIDILESSNQEVIAKRLGFSETGFLLENYFRHIKDIKSFVIAYMEKNKRGEGIFENWRRKLISSKVSKYIYFLDGIFYPVKTVYKAGTLQPPDILNCFQLSLLYESLLSHEFCNVIRSIVKQMPSRAFISRSIYNIFRQILEHDHPGQTLVQLLETGVLEKIIPEFKNLICKVEYDTYHEYTVDQHTLLMLACLDTLKADEDKNLYHIFKSIKNKFLLRLCFLLHDIGKIVPGDHSRNGAIIAARIGDRLGLNPREIAQIQFVIYNHLLLSEFSLTREWEKEALEKLAGQINNKTNLNMLYILTVLDIKNVGSKTWTEWKGVQLKELYAKVLAILIQTSKKKKSIKENDSNAPFYTFPISDQNNHKKWLHAFLADDDKSGIHLYTDDFADFIRLTVIGRDRKNFFTDIVSCISSEGYNILSARISSTEDAAALDIFYLEPDIHTHITTGERIQNIRKKWEMIRIGQRKSYELIEERLKMYPGRVSDRIRNEKSYIKIDNDKSKQYTILEVKTRDRFGLLFRISHILNQLDINIFSAKLSTRVDRAVDVFYINDKFGQKITDSGYISHLKTTLETSLASML